MKYGMDEKLMINLIDYLWGYAEKHGTRCIWLDGSPDEEPYSRITKYNTKEILVNINWKHANLLPFKLGHIIGHLEHNDKHLNEELLKFDRDTIEKHADLYAAGLISGYALKNGLNFMNYRELYCNFGIPLYLLNC